RRTGSHASERIPACCRMGDAAQQCYGRGRGPGSPPGAPATLRLAGSVESIMIRFILAVTVAGALIAAGARAQTPAPEDNRYQLGRVEDGYLRLDLKTGQVSLCSRRSAGWACVTVPDDRAAFDGEIARLQGENAALKKAMLDRGLS